MANDDSGKFLVALFFVAILILGIVSLSNGATGSNLLTNIFGGVTSLTGGGNNGSTGTYANGTLIGNGIIVPASVISFKTSIQADYSDGSTETIYQASNLPGLAIISVHGKPIRDVTALEVVALAFKKPAPAGTMVTFSTNVTDQIEGVSAGWWYRQVQTPLVANNSLALMAFPPVSVLPTDIFPAGQSLNSNVQRRVTWDASVTATVQAPPGYSLSLISISGDSISFAEINGDFSLGSGCTNCGGTSGPGGGPTGGGTTASGTISGGTIHEFQAPNPNSGCTSNCNSVTVGNFNLNTMCLNANPCGGGYIPPTPTPPPSCTGPNCGVSVSSGTAGNGGTVSDNKQTKQQTVVKEDVKPLGAGASGGGPGKFARPMSLIDPGCDLSTGSSSCGLPAMNYTYWTNPLTGQTYMVNPLFAGLLIFLGLAFVVAAVTGSERKKK